jgi:histidinol phosphatase-like PHP family hydrolase
VIRIVAKRDFHVHSSAFSIYDGLGLPKLHVERAKELGWGAVCLTEHGWMGSAPTLYKDCQGSWPQADPRHGDVRRARRVPDS